MTIVLSPLFAWLFACAGMLIYTCAVCLTLARRGLTLPKLLIPALLPAAGGLLVGRLGYLLLQQDASADPLVFCYTAGAAGLVLGAWLAARLTGTSKPLSLLDETAPWLCAAMALARFGQRWLEMVGAGNGLEEDSPFNRVPFALVDELWGDSVLAVFVLEAIWALLALVICLLLRRSGRAVPGVTLCQTVSILLVPQVLLEQLREGHYMKWRLLRTEQVLIAVLALAALIALCALFSKRKPCGLAAWWPVPVFVLCIAVVAVMEFVMDGKLFELSEAACWVIYTGALLVMLAMNALSAHRVLRAAEGSRS